MNVPGRKVSMLLPYSIADTFELLSNEDSGRLIKAMLAYEIEGTEPEFEKGSSLRFAWLSNIKGIIDHNKEKYEAVLEKRRTAGRKGGLAKSENQEKEPEAPEVAKKDFAKQNVANAKKDVANVANDSKCYKSSYPQENGDYPQEDSKAVDKSSVANATFAKQMVANAKKEVAKHQMCYEKLANCSDHDHDHDHDHDIKNHPSISTTEEDYTEGVDVKGPAAPAQEKIPDTSSGSLDGWMDEKYKLKSKDAWDAFWNAYPRKGGNINEVKSAFLQLTVQGVAPGDLISAAEKYARELVERKTDPKYFKMPLNFLRQDVWRSYIPRYLPSCPYCRGQGVYKDGDAMRMCSCDTRYKGVKA